MNDPNARELWWHGTAARFYIVYHGTRTPIVAKTTASVSNQVTAALAEGIVNKTGEPGATAMFFLETLPEVAPSPPITVGSFVATAAETTAVRAFAAVTIDAAG